MRLLLLGNSGSGKSTYAAWLARTHGLAHLDLDTIMWELGKVAVARPVEDSRRDLIAFVDGHADWVIEGCYAGIVEAVLPRCTELVFLNPGLDVCLAHARARPWEPHKYASREAQDAVLPFLLAWIEEYYTRDDTLSLAAHRRLFDAFAGPKREVTEPIRL